MTKKKAPEEVILDITIIPEKITIGHIRMISASSEVGSSEPIHKILDALQEMTVEDIFSYPLESVPAVMKAIGDQMNDVANPEGESGNL